MPVSVIIPVFNRHKYIRKAVESVLNQTYQDFELIIIDDASTDGTSEILQDLAAGDARITLLRQPVNVGGPTGRNWGLSQARYDLVACMDDDDIMLPDRLQSQAKFLEKYPDISVLSSAAYMINGDGNIIATTVPTIDIERGLKEHDPSLIVNIIHPTTMYRKEAVLGVGGYRNYLLDDRDLWGRMVLAGYKIAVSADPVLMHRRHSSIMTTKIREVFENGDFIDFNIIRRMRGENEVDLHEYRKIIASRSLWQRLVAWKKLRAGISFRLATLHYGNRNWLPFLTHLVVAVMFEPMRYIRRILLKRRQDTFGDSNSYQAAAV